MLLHWWTDGKCQGLRAHLRNRLHASLLVVYDLSGLHYWLTFVFGITITDYCLWCHVIRQLVGYARGGSPTIPMWDWVKCVWEGFYQKRKEFKKTNFGPGPAWSSPRERILLNWDSPGNRSFVTYHLLHWFQWFMKVMCPFALVLF